MLLSTFVNSSRDVNIKIVQNCYRKLGSERGNGP